MKILLMADMEGVSGIINWDQVNGGAPLFEEGRRLYTEEVNAAVRGAKRAGATEIVAVDCHGAGSGWNFNSFIPEMMECDWVSGHAWSRYTELLEEGCDAALMVGMHARANTPDGGMCHTISTTSWRNLYFNKDLVGEFGINAALCGHYDCPVVLITGDEATCREGQELLGKGLHTAQVKKSLSRYSARNVPPKKAREIIEEAAYKSLTTPIKVKPYKPGKPCTITVDLGSVDHAASFMGRQGVEIVDPLKVVSKGKDWMTAWNQIWKWT
ncbi:MAG TPA: M55 family metallopeptidase [Tepidisphaeraceae bacterium]|jgi:D-amino peptidase|nr:M55 family metallopeptidase [Tepidisphaeraceae bacterium]